MPQKHSPPEPLYIDLVFVAVDIDDDPRIWGINGDDVTAQPGNIEGRGSDI